jgi:hypothetical protein
VLREQIHDPQRENPEIRMPLIGRHKIISDAYIDATIGFCCLL